MPDAIPPPPAGFKIVGDDSIPPPPPGFKLETDTKKSSGGPLGGVFNSLVDATQYGKGILKEGAKELENIGDISTLGAKPLLERTIPALGKQRKQIEERTQLRTPGEKTGSKILQGAELLAPVPGLGEIKAGANAGRLARAGVTAAKGALDMGLKTAVQTGDPKEAATAALVGGATAGALEPILSTAGRKIQASTIRPRLSDMKDGFKWSTLDKFKLKGNLEQSMKQVDSKLTELRNQRNSYLAPGQGTVDLTAPFNEAANEVINEAMDLKHGGESAKVIDALGGLQKDVMDILGGNPKVDIRKAENLKEHLGTLGAWSYGRPDRDSQTIETVANKLYLKVKDAIEKSLSGAGPKVKALNKQMQELIPVKNAMLARLPVEERNRMFSLQDIITMLPAAMGEPSSLALTGLSMAQKSLRFGNFLNRTAPAVATGLGRTAGTASRLVDQQ
jgi:hypothetical protein